ncbi:hypothetical protein LY76DRAFT_595067 [Colletotrichum caudatum]|nr:hypothetical protein LY76DRAFT_595067 [Colletotrichum caudatum]
MKSSSGAESIVNCFLYLICSSSSGKSFPAPAIPPPAPSSPLLTLSRPMPYANRSTGIPSFTAVPATHRWHQLLAPVRQGVLDDWIDHLVWCRVKGLVQFVSIWLLADVSLPVPGYGLVTRCRARHVWLVCGKGPPTVGSSFLRNTLVSIGAFSDATRNMQHVPASVSGVVCGSAHYIGRLEHSRTWAQSCP